MSSPAKPWEGTGANLRSDRDISSLSIQSTSRLPDINIKSVPVLPPPLPPRPTNVGARRHVSSIGASQLYRSYPSTYGGYNSVGGYGNYNNFGVYNGLGGFGGSHYPGLMYNYNNTNDPNNRFVALAEERTRPAFESIESVVRAFGSVSFLLESTLGALHASFRAALGVADQLSHLRNVLSALSIFRLLQWIIRRLKLMFGVKYQDPTLGNCWGDAVKVGEQTASGVVPPNPTPGASYWPLGIFLGLVASGSILAWKVLAYVMGPDADNVGPFKGEENEPWVQGKETGCFLAYANHDFQATLDQELSFRAGDRLIIAPRSRQPLDSKDWLLAANVSCTRRGGTPKIGLVPSNYIRAIERKNIRVPLGNPLISNQSIPVGVHSQIQPLHQLGPYTHNFPAHSGMSSTSFPTAQSGMPPDITLQRLPSLDSLKTDTELDVKAEPIQSTSQLATDEANTFSKYPTYSQLQTPKHDTVPTGENAQSAAEDPFPDSKK